MGTYGKQHRAVILALVELLLSIQSHNCRIHHSNALDEIATNLISFALFVSVFSVNLFGLHVHTGSHLTFRIFSWVFTGN